MEELELEMDVIPKKKPKLPLTAERSPEELEITRGRLKEDQLRVKRLLFRNAAHPVWSVQKALESLPKDAVVIDCISDFQTHSWGFIVRSKSYSPVKEGEAIPNIELQVDGIKKEVKASKSFADALADL